MRSRVATKRATIASLLGLLLVSCSDKGQFDTDSTGRFEHEYALDASQWTLADEQADLTDLLESLESIAAWHNTADTGISLQAALPDSEYSALVQEFPCSVPREAETLWRWKNGESTDYFIWYHGFLPLEEAVKQYKYLQSEPMFGWRQTWIPIFQFQDEWYFVECRRAAGDGSPVIFYFTESGPSYAYTNLTTYMKTMAAAMDRGVLTWEENWWNDEFDVSLLAAIHSEFNALARFPYALD